MCYRSTPFEDSGGVAQVCAAGTDNVRLPNTCVCVSVQKMGILGGRWKVPDGFGYSDVRAHVSRGHRGTGSLLCCVCEQGVVGLIRMCLEVNPSRRPTIMEVIAGRRARRCGLLELAPTLIERVPAPARSGRATADLASAGRSDTRFSCPSCCCCGTGAGTRACVGGRERIEVGEWAPSLQAPPRRPSVRDMRTAPTKVRLTDDAPAVPVRSRTCVCVCVCVLWGARALGAL